MDFYLIKHRKCQKMPLPRTQQRENDLDLELETLDCDRQTKYGMKQLYFRAHHKPYQDQVLKKIIEAIKFYFLHTLVNFCLCNKNPIPTRTLIMLFVIVTKSICIKSERISD